MADIHSNLSSAQALAEAEVRCTLRKEKISAAIRYTILLFVGLLMLYPLAWMFSASFKPNHEIFTTLGLWPEHATSDGFVNGWKTGTEYNFGHYMLNTFKFVIPKVILTMFQNYALYPHMTVRENLAFGLKLAKLPKEKIEEQVNEAAKILELEDLMDRLPRQLSGGQAQRVAVGRAIVKKPGVFLFDEPLSNLDAKLRASMRIRISDPHKQLKKSGKPATSVYVTHDQTEAMTMGDRICVMKLGHIMQVDTPDNLYHYPKNMFVAGFIGALEMNIKPGKLVETNGQIALHVGGYTLPLNAAQQDKVRSHLTQDIFFGVRPEYVSVSDTAFEDNHSVGELVRVENMGHEFFMYIKVDGFEITSRIPSEEARLIIKNGLNRQVFFKFDMDKCHIFDAKTEQNISL